MGHPADTQLFLLQQVHLVGADLFWPELIRRTMEVFGEGLYRFQRGVYGSRRVITTLEFLQHQFA
ncbi:MAG: hypothetical protein A3H27_01465 [Acidobacteria bacterium RIFCSPLOWO2_02_FULL_59_13]|nr:MAG: hypothetical protein A3H27_01465 [Acidobacteria bacterium RIFCSPLOWO2_02_FULL_59_13]